MTTDNDYSTAQDAINRLLRASGGNKVEQDALRAAIYALGDAWDARA